MTALIDIVTAFVVIKQIYIILILLCLISIASYLHFCTSLEYTTVVLEPVSIYYSVTRNNIPFSNFSKQKYPIKCVEFTINNLFKGAYHEAFLKDEHSHLSVNKLYKGTYNELRIKFVDFKKEINFWDEMGNNESQYNSLRAEKYMHDNMPDLLISAPFIQNKKLPIWSQVSQSQPGIAIKAEPFLKRTSYCIWESKYFFDTKFTGLHFNDETYLRADADYLLFEVLIPEKYKIVNFENVQLEKVSGGYLLRKKIESGNTFNLILQDQKREMIKTIIGFISPALFGTALGIFIKGWFLS